MTETLPLISHDPWVQAAYERMRAEGTSHRLAEMFALQQPPMSCTDREFLEGHCNGSQFAGQEHVGDYYRSVATAAGQDVTGKVYLSGLAAYPGDPQAWVSGRGDVERVVRQRGWSAEGLVNVKPTQIHEHKPVGLDESLVQDEVDGILETVPDPRAVDREDLADQVREKRKPHWAK